VNALQDGRLGAIAGNKPYVIDARYCSEHPLLLDRVTGDVTPGGTITATGACFGSAAGQVQMLGNFPSTNGTVNLAVQSWTDDSVTAKIPAIAGAPDQSVEIRLVHYASIYTATVLGRAGATNVSPRVRMSFLAERQLVNALTSVENDSCAQGAHPSQDLCSKVTSWTGSALCPFEGCVFAYHNQLAADSGTDTWRVHLPPGWRFDRIELQSATAEVLIDQTIDPTNVTWNVRWHTIHGRSEKTHVGNHITYNEFDDGSYMFFLYATGASGTWLFYPSDASDEL